MSTFFGCYISNISTNISWGGDGGTCQLTLVEDPSSGANIKMAEIGAPVGLTVGNFYFGGIFQRWSYKESISGRLYDIVLESAAKYLDGIQIVLTNFNGLMFSQADPLYPSQAPLFTNQIYNVWNVFAHHENSQSGGYYGGSQVNSAGIPADLALETIQNMSYGGYSIFGDKARFGSFQYSVDLSELISQVPQGYRLSGPIQSLQAIIQDVCEASGLDYYVELQGRTSGSSDLITNPVIKIRTISRAAQPSLGIVEDIISREKSSGRLISSNYGREWAAPTAQKMIIGGKASRYIVQPINRSYPCWGKNANNTYIFSPEATTDIIYSNPVHRIPILLDEYANTIGYYASMFELRMASGGRDSWEAFKMFETMYGVEFNGYNNIYNCPWLSKVEANSNIINFLITGQLAAIDMIPTSASYTQKRYLKYVQEIGDKIWGAVSRVASNYYGQVFAMELDYMEPGGVTENIRWIRDDVQYESVWRIADSAWVDTKPFADVAFYDGDGRLKAGCAWPSDTRYDYSEIGGNWAITPDGGVASNSGGPDKDLFWVNDKLYVMCRSGGRVLGYDALTTPDFGLSVLIYLFTGNWVNPAAYFTAGMSNVQISIPPVVIPPSSFGIPQESDRYAWGPWYGWSGGPVGKSSLEYNDSLAPETFGDKSSLDTAAFAMAAQGLAQSAVNETGSIEIAGLPFANVADRFGGGGPYLNGIDVTVDANQTSTTYKFNSWTPQFGKMTMTNIERMKKIHKGTLALAQSRRANIQQRPLPKIPFQKTDFAELSEAFKGQSVQMFHSSFTAIAAGVQNYTQQPPTGSTGGGSY